MSDLKAEQFMQKPVSVIAVGTPLREAAKLLNDRNVSGAPVVETDGNPVGVLSVRDINSHVGRGEEKGSFYDLDFVGRVKLTDDDSLNGAVVEDIMTPGFISVSPDLSFQDVARTLFEKKIHRTFVARGNEILGVISTMDILRVLCGKGH